MLVFSTLLVYSPGVQIELPDFENEPVPGIQPPVIPVAVDVQGKIFFESQHVPEEEFESRLKEAVRKFESPPTLVIQGADDEYGTLAQVEAAREKCGGATEIKVLQACGHSPHRDQTELVLASVSRFLAR